MRTESRIRLVSNEVSHLVEGRDIADLLARRIIAVLDVAESEAEAVLGEVVDWLGVPDWTGPQLPDALARRIAEVLHIAGSEGTS